jgi:hypothetical protein
VKASQSFYTFKRLIKVRGCSKEGIAGWGSRSENRISKAYEGNSPKKDN